MIWFQSLDGIWLERIAQCQEREERNSNKNGAGGSGVERVGEMRLTNAWLCKDAISIPSHSAFLQL